MHRPLLKFCVGHYLPDITFSLIGSMTLEVIASIVIIMFLSHFLKKNTSCNNREFNINFKTLCQIFSVCSYLL